MKRNISMSLVLSLVMLVLISGCASTTTTIATTTAKTTAATTTAAATTVATTTEKVISNDKITIKLAYDIGLNFPEKSTVRSEIEKTLNIDMVSVTMASADLPNHINLMIAANTLEDIILVQNVAKFLEMRDGGLLVEMQDMMQKYGKNILENKGEMMKAGPGTLGTKIYGIPRGGRYTAASTIRKDWLDNLNLPIPKTLDEFITTLKAFRDNDPDKNNVKDTIPMCLALTYPTTFTAIFGAYGIPYTVDQGAPMCQFKDGKIVPSFLDPAYLDAIKTFNMLYKEKLIDPEFATIAMMSELEKLWNGKIGAICNAAEGTTQNWLPRYVENPKPVFVYFDMKGPTGKSGTPLKNPSYAPPWTCITKNCKNPERALMLLDFLVSDKGDKLNWFGIEGTHYKLVDGKAQRIAPYADVLEQRKEGITMFSLINQRINGSEIQVMDPLTLGGRQLAEKTGILYVQTAAVPQILIDTGSILLDIEKEALVTLISTSDDITTQYTKFTKKWLGAGGQTLIDQLTEIYKKENSIK